MTAAPDQQPPVKGPGGGTPPRQDETDLWMLVHDHGVKPRDGARIMGMHHKRLWYLCDKWSRQGKYDYGVSCDLGWSEARHQPPPRPRPGVQWIGLPPEGPDPKWFHHVPPPGGAPPGMATMVVNHRPKPAEQSVTTRVAMEGRLMDPVLRAAAEKAAAAVKHEALRSAARIMVGVDPAPASPWAGHHTAMVTAMLMHGQVFIQHGHVPRPTPHLTVHEDGRVQVNVQHRSSIMQWIADQPMPTTPRGGIRYQ